MYSFIWEVVLGSTGVQVKEEQGREGKALHCGHLGLTSLGTSGSQ